MTIQTEPLKDYSHGFANPHTIFHWLFWPSLSTEDCMLDRRFVPGPQDILGEQGLLKQLTKAIIERCLEAELDTFLGYPKHAHKSSTISNARNGYSQKTLRGNFGQVDIAVPRDRQGAFNPQMVKKGQMRLAGLDEKIVAFYARGMTNHDIQVHLQELYGLEVSPTLMANVTEAVIDEVRQWQTRALEQVYSIVYIDFLFVNAQGHQWVRNFAVYLILGVNLSGQKELLDVWLAQSEGANFWLSVFMELQNRGVKDIFIACVDGLAGLPEALETVYPLTKAQMCMVHLVRNSPCYVSHKQRRLHPRSEGNLLHLQ